VPMSTVAFSAASEAVSALAYAPDKMAVVSFSEMWRRPQPRRQLHRRRCRGAGAG
jgi:hypothetical protein